MKTHPGSAHHKADDAEVLAALMGEFGRVEPEMRVNDALSPPVEIAGRPPVDAGQLKDAYDAQTDLARARDYGFAIIRERMAAGGPGWLIGASVEVDAPPRREPPVDPEMWLRRASASPSWWRRLLAVLGWRSMPPPSSPDQPTTVTAARRNVAISAAMRQAELFARRRR
jgi:hypothetical protein